MTTSLDRMQAFKRQHWCRAKNGIAARSVYAQYSRDPITLAPGETIWRCEYCDMKSNGLDWDHAHNEVGINSIAPDKRMSGRMAVDILRNPDLWEAATIKRAQMLAVELLTKTTRLLD